MTAFEKLISESNVAWPRLQLLKIGGFINRDFAEKMLHGNSAERLKIQGGLGHEGTFGNSVLRGWDFFEWNVDGDGAVVYQVIRGSRELMFRERIQD